MPLERLEKVLSSEIAELDASGTAKRCEDVIVGVIGSAGGLGPRYILKGEGEKPFLRMNSNSYLGMSLAQEVIAAEERAARDFGAGPGAVRFISGTWAPHVELEQRLAAFHRREAAMLLSSAYAAVVGVLAPLVTPETAVISDELNHNSIINALRLARPGDKRVYRHCDMAELESQLREMAGRWRRVVVVTDGVFSMRGDYAPLAEIMELARTHNAAFPENIVVMVDDSHGVGALGATGRGTEEQTDCAPADLLVATLGKAIGVNGGYVAASRTVIDYLREKSPFYVYSNPITPAEAAAATEALRILDSPQGLELLAHLREVTRRFETGLIDLGHETIPGEHPIVPLMVRDTARTSALVGHLRRHGVLATGLNFPVVPRGDEEIRFQLSADHTPADLDAALDVLANFV